MPKLSRLLSPWKIGSLEIKNRIVMSPMTLVWCNPDETPSDRQIAYWTERAKGGVGLIITEMNSVDALHRYQPLSVGPAQRLPDREPQAPDRRRAQVRRQHIPTDKPPRPRVPGPVLREHAGHRPVGEPLRVHPQVCRELADDELPALVEMFAEAARRAREAGYDGVELHMAHNYCCWVPFSLRCATSARKACTSATPWKGASSCRSRSSRG